MWSQKEAQANYANLKAIKALRVVIASSDADWISRSLGRTGDAFPTEVVLE